jgi:hypothetical protein
MERVDVVVGEFPCDLVVRVDGICATWRHRNNVIFHLKNCEMGALSWKHLLVLMQNSIDDGTRCELWMEDCSVRDVDIGWLADAAMIVGMHRMDICDIAMLDATESIRQLLYAAGSVQCTLENLRVDVTGCPTAGIVNCAADLVWRGCRLTALTLGGDMAHDDLRALWRLYAAAQSNHTLEEICIQHDGPPDTDATNLVDRARCPITAPTDTMIYQTAAMTWHATYIILKARSHVDIPRARDQCLFDFDGQASPSTTVAQSRSRIWKSEEHCIDGLHTDYLPGVRICPADFPLDMEQICAYAVQVAPDAEFIVIG